MRIKNILNLEKIIFGVGLILITSGCASFGQKLKAMLNNGEPSQEQVSLKNSKAIKFSENKEIPVDENRSFRRMTRDQFEKEAMSNDNGSLWVSEGQGSFLFSQNTQRVLGDSINVILDGEPKKQLSTKSNVLHQLFKKPRAVAAVPTPAEGVGAATPPAVGPDGQPLKPDPNAPAAAPATAAAKPVEPKEEEKEVFTMSLVPSRIVERLQDGNYRVRGSQNMMIGKHEYRVIVTGIAKPSDVTEEGVSSMKLLDSKFDIVSLRKDLKEMER